MADTKFNVEERERRGKEKEGATIAKLSFKTPSICTPHGRRSHVTSNVVAEASVLPLDGDSCAAQKAWSHLTR